MVRDLNNRLIQGDALDVCAALPPASFDFIYCDPPFFSGQVRRNGARAKGSTEARFDDRWPSMEGYIAWLDARVRAMHALLKPEGVFALHLDWHAVHYAKVMCDGIFGYDRFINEIVWAFRTGGAGKRTLARKHDTILVYGKSARYVFNPQREKSYLSHRYGFSNVTLGEDEHGVYRYALMRDVWDIAALRGNQPESAGYPTQKPLALIERLIACFTNPGALVGDFLCGSGTTAVAAVNQGRRYVCSDGSAAAISVAAKRLAVSGGKMIFS